MADDQQGPSTPEDRGYDPATAEGNNMAEPWYKRHAAHGRRS